MGRGGGANPCPKQFGLYLNLLNIFAKNVVQNFQKLVGGGSRVLWTMSKTMQIFYLDDLPKQRKFSTELEPEDSVWWNITIALQP